MNCPAAAGTVCFPLEAQKLSGDPRPSGVSFCCGLFQRTQGGSIVDSGLFIILGPFVLGLVCGLLRKKQPAKKDNWGWIGLALLVALFLCLWTASTWGTETASFFVGMSAMALLPLIFLFAIGYRLGTIFRRDKT
jgi:hypothetical protein